MDIFYGGRGLGEGAGHAPKQCFRRIQSCLDYKAYVHDIKPELSPVQYEQSRCRLMTLGRADKERMGVVYVYGPWGFFVIPGHGYPDLRVNFYHDTSITEMNGIMASICAVLDASDVAFNQGELDE